MREGKGRDKEKESSEGKSNHKREEGKRRKANETRNPIEKRRADSETARSRRKRSAESTATCDVPHALFLPPPFMASWTRARFHGKKVICRRLAAFMDIAPWPTTDDSTLWIDYQWSQGRTCTIGRTFRVEQSRAEQSFRLAAQHFCVKRSRCPSRKEKGCMC